MRFLHTGDLHLDSSFCSSNILIANERREAQRRTFGRIFELAREEKCQMVLISGDLFDSKYVTPETRRYVLEVFSSSDIPIVIAPGNHDPYIAGSFYKSADIPENVYIFSSSELQCFDFPELATRVFGYAFTSPSLTVSPLVGARSDKEGDEIRLLCAHADLAAPISRYCPVTVGDISGLDIDYAALGHIHNRAVDDSAGGSVVRYCGFPEGRSFDETGDGGVFIVDCEVGGNVSYKRVSVSQQKYEIREIDISDRRERSEITALIRDTVAEISEDKASHLRLLLQGCVDCDELPDIKELERELTVGNVLSLEIRNMTVPVADILSLSTDPTLRGEFYRALYSGLVDEDPKVRERTALALQIGLSAIEGRRIIGGKDGI